MENLFPKKNNSGSVGKMNGSTILRSWLYGCFKYIGLNGVLYTPPATDGTNGQCLKTNGSGTLSWGSASGATAWDDIADPDAAGTVAFTSYAQTLTSTKTNGDMVTISGLGDFGDVSVLKVEQSTGNPTDGTVLEVVSADANCDALVVTANGTNVLAVTGAGAFNVTGTTGITGDTTVTGNLSVTGTWETDALAASTPGGTIAINGDTTGGVNIGSVSTGGITLGGAVTVADGKDVTIGEGQLTIDNDQVNEVALTITSAGTTAGGAIDITAATTTGNVVMVTANDLGTGGAMVLLDSDNIATDNFYLECYNGSADEFTVAKYGATTIAGTASTDVLTITAGDLQITAGDIDIDLGRITIDNTADESNTIKRNNATGTLPVLEVEETNATGGTALLVDSNATDGNDALVVEHDGTGSGLKVTGTAATGTQASFIGPASQTASIVKVDGSTGSWIGAATTGMLHLTSDGALVADASLLRIASSGNIAAANDGACLEILETGNAQATTYAVKIDSTSNEALHVATGKALFDEQPTFTSGIDADGSVDIDFSANTEVFTLDTSANDYAAGTGVATLYASAAGGATNATYLLRMAYKADGDAQDHFILCQDNSTGAAANGDEKFSVSTGGLTKCLGGIAPGSATDSYMKCDTVNLTSAEVKALKASPKELIAAPGADKFIEVVSLVLILDYGSNVFTETADNLVLQYGTSGDDITAAIEMTGFIDQAADTIMAVYPVHPWTANAAADMVNNAVQLYNPNDEIEGNAGNDSQLTCKITYWVHTAGLA